MIPIHMRQAMRRIRECRNLPTNKVINGKSLPSHAMAGYNQHGLQWLAFSFESVSYYSFTVHINAQTSTFNGNYLKYMSYIFHYRCIHHFFYDNFLFLFQTTYKGQSYFTAYSEYREWQHFIDYIKNEVLPEGSPLTSIYQTSEFWTSVSTGGLMQGGGAGAGVVEMALPKTLPCIISLVNIILICNLGLFHMQVTYY